MLNCNYPPAHCKKFAVARTPLTLGQQKGRTRISGTGKPPKKFKRVAISYAYKLSVLSDSETGWELLRRLLEEVPVVRHAVDTRHDIENFVVPEEELDN
eukprot:jgi/Phyca11/126417/e_gw1.63.164.1